MADSVPADSFATQIRLPRGLIASPDGPSPTWMGVTRLEAGSKRDTDPSRPFATQTACAPKATADGPLPTVVATTLPVVASTRERTPRDSLVTHSAPSPIAIASAPASTEIRRPTVPLVGSIR